MLYSLDEAQIFIHEKFDKRITPRQIRQFAIEGKVNLCFLFRGTAINCGTDDEEEIYGYPYVPCAKITEIEIHGFVFANMFIWRETLYKILEGSSVKPEAIRLTSEKLLIDESELNNLVPSDKTTATTYLSRTPKDAPTKAMPATAPIEVIKHRLRRNTLDPLIDKAVQQAGNKKLADVYLKLKDLALNGESPFTGIIDNDALCYTGDNNTPKKLTKNALSGRLRRR